MQLTEPTTLITDYVLGAVSMFLGSRLIIFGLDRRQRSVLFWGIAFVATAMAALVGGTYHGFLGQLGSSGQFVLWKLTMLFAGAMSFSMLTGSLLGTVNPSLWPWVIALTVSKFVVFLIFVTKTDNFLVVIMDYLPAMVGVLICHLIQAYKSPSPSHLWISCGVLISVFGAWLQQENVGLSPNFNHNDLYHVIQTVGMVAFFKGAALLRDKEEVWRQGSVEPSASRFS